MKLKRVKKFLAATLSAAMLFTGSVNGYAAENVAAVETEETEAVGETDAYDWDGEKSAWSEAEFGAAFTDKALQGTTGNFNGVFIDASTGKVAGQGAGKGFAQCNLGTKFYIPVKNGNLHKITVKAYHNKQVDVYKVQTAEGTFTPEGEVELTANENSFTCKPVKNEERGRYEILVEMTKGDYLYSFSVEEVEVTGDAYAVTVNSSDDTMGTASASLTEANEGLEVSLTAKANPGYKFKEWTSEDASVSNNKFTMPGKAVTVTAVFEKMEEFAITTKTTGKGSVSADSATAYEGKEVSLTATPAEGYVFTKWETNNKDVEVKGNKFTMPAGAVEVTAVFEEKTLENSSVEAGEYNFASIKAGEISVQGLTPEGIDGTGNSHGIYVAQEADGKLKLSLKENANITIMTCCFNAGVDAAVTPSTGEVSKSEWDESGKPGLKFVITGMKKGEQEIVISKNTYIHSMAVEYVKDVGARDKIDVWDFGGKVETDSKYINNITPENYIASKAFEVKGLFNKGNFVFGDLTLTSEAKDRLYTKVEALAGYNQGDYGMAQTDKYGAEYAPLGGWYCNGSGGPTRRYVTIANVQAGDKIVCYMGITQNGPSEMFFEGQGGANGQQDKVAVVATEFKKSEFIADKTGTYKIYEGNAGKPMYHRIMRYPYVNVTGSIDLGGYTGKDFEIKFINETTQKETTAEVNGTTFTAHLAPGYDYMAVLQNATGYGLTTASNKIATTDAESLTGKDGVKLVAEEKKQYAYEGSVKGFADGYNLSTFKLVFDPVESGVADKVTAKLDGSKFAAILQDSVSYNVVISGVNDYEIKNTTPVSITAENKDAAVEVVLKKLNQVTGKFFGNDDKEVTKLTFENVDDKYTYDAEVKDGGYSVSLRKGAYLAKATVADHKTQTHVVVEDEAVNKDLMFVSTAAKAKIAKKSDIYVGYPDKADNYATMREAMEACTLMDPQPTSEADRITVHIAPGTYREQIFVDTPYVSFVNDSGKEVNLTWYYGIGYKYYSSDDYYNPEKAYDKYDKKIAAKWGTAVYVKKTAANFRAEGIKFENSFNRYVTEEEIADGIECDTLKVDRTVISEKEVQSKASTERATALVIEAPYTEFKDCEFYSSQDTLYTAETAYFKDCFIEGQTDYIFGSGNVVFDTCNLSWKGYSANSQGGYITANRPDADSELGYLFRNCVITESKAKYAEVTPGYFGRPWGNLAKVRFVNTKVENPNTITADGWYEMSGVKPQDVTFLEYNTTDYEGNAIDTSKRVKGTNCGVMTDEQAKAIDVVSYFADKAGKIWTPKYYVAETAEVKFETKPFISDNGDLNTPYPGHTLTVGYSLGEANNANDVSEIKWYAVKDGKDTLVKASNAAADKTYKIQKEDTGSKIKVVVKPVTISGKTADAAECVTEFAVLEGYDDPTGKTDPVLGDGINVFLAGDSTVKDYSASGMNSGGKARSEGSWGEFLQAFLNDKATVVDYAEGGRSSRSFINEGSLDKIAAKIKAGDYLLIQFGHNDCSNDPGYIDERYCPIGKPDANGIYPVTEGKKVTTPAGLAGRNYGDQCYTYDCGGTYKWYLKQYVEVAKKAGATPILMTPVARLYYTADGKIRPHHDESIVDGVKNENMSNTYCEAVRQLAKEENVLLIDAYNITEQLYTEAYAAGGNEVYGVQLMNVGDKTHNNKIGGFIEAEKIAEAILETKADGNAISLSRAVQMPSKVKGVDASGKLVISVDGDKVETFNVADGYASHAEYWEKSIKDMLAGLAAKIPTQEPTKIPAATIIPTATVSATIVPTATVSAPAATVSAPTATVSAPAATVSAAVVPTATVSAPTATVSAPTATVSAPAATVSATAVPTAAPAATMAPIPTVDASSKAKVELSMTVDTALMSEKVVAAMNAKLASEKDTVALTAGTKKNTLKLDLTSLSGNSTVSEAVITLMKGSKVETGIETTAEKKTGSQIDKKGVIKAKKATGETPDVYTINGKTVKVYVVEGEVKDGSKNKATVKPNEPFTIRINTVLDKNVTLTGKAKASVASFGGKVYYDDNGYLVIKGIAGAKGSAKLTYSINGKKYKVAIKIK